MQIKDVENLAELAKIELSEKEKETLLQDVSGILDYVKQIQDVEVSDEEAEHFSKNSWREDAIKKEDFDLSIIKEQYNNENDFVKVKKVL
jgi:aspartyl-tRNA(Asn)/glutamyl-tRNA(Gln) amidotransferase subunit C